MDPASAPPPAGPPAIGKQASLTRRLGYRYRRRLRAASFFWEARLAIKQPVTANQPRTQHSRVGMLRQNNQHTPGQTRSETTQITCRCQGGYGPSWVLSLWPNSGFFFRMQFHYPLHGESLLKPETRLGPEAAARSVSTSREEHPSRCWPTLRRLHSGPSTAISTPSGPPGHA